MVRNIYRDIYFEFNGQNTIIVFFEINTIIVFIILFKDNGQNIIENTILLK